jgi:hypothetical protein
VVRVIQGYGRAPDPKRKLLSYSPKGDPAGYSAETATALQRALQFGSLPPDRLDFTVVTTPSSDTVKLKPGALLPEHNFLTQTFRQCAYRNVHIHYWIDPHSLTFTRDSSGSYRDEVQFVVIVYRDDGVEANSFSSFEHVQVAAEDMEDPLNSGITYDQTIAVPISANPIPGNFYLRIAVDEHSSNRVGAIEIPTEWIKLPPPQTIASATKQSP